MEGRLGGCRQGCGEGRGRGVGRGTVKGDNTLPSEEPRTRASVSE